MSDLNQFEILFKGSFKGVMRWPQLDDLWSQIKINKGDAWYIYAVGEAPPEEVSSTEKLHRFLDELTSLLKKDHGEDYCGVVYADNLSNPSIVKVYDPNNLGSSCGCSGLQVFPGWVISKAKPDDLKVIMPPPNSRRRWWSKLFS